MGCRSMLRCRTDGSRVGGRCRSVSESGSSVEKVVAGEGEYLDRDPVQLLLHVADADTRCPLDVAMMCNRSDERLEQDGLADAVWSDNCQRGRASHAEGEVFEDPSRAEADVQIA